MELREIIKIFKENSRLFIGTVLFFVVLGAVLFLAQPKAYSVNLMLNVTRKAIQNTPDYRYDDFYRLQADERFADTVVRWLGSPQISQQIYREAGTEPQKNIKASRLSSQMIETVFVLENKEDARKFSEAVLKVLNRQTEILNEAQKEESWFVLVAGDPFVAQKKIGPAVAFSVSVLLGLFFGAWSVMIAYYLKRG